MKKQVLKKFFFFFKLESGCICIGWIYVFLGTFLILHYPVPTYKDLKKVQGFNNETSKDKFIVICENIGIIFMIN